MILSQREDRPRRLFFFSEPWARSWNQAPFSWICLTLAEENDWKKSESSFTPCSSLPENDSHPKVRPNRTLDAGSHMWWHAISASLG
jgi:hypothetical protein